MKHITIIFCVPCVFLRFATKVQKKHLITNHNMYNPKHPVAAGLGGFGNDAAHTMYDVGSELASTGYQALKYGLNSLGDAAYGARRRHCENMFKDMTLKEFTQLKERQKAQSSYMPSVPSVTGMLSFPVDAVVARSQNANISKAQAAQAREASMLPMSTPKPPPPVPTQQAVKQKITFVYKDQYGVPFKERTTNYKVSEDGLVKHRGMPNAVTCAEFKKKHENDDALKGLQCQHLYYSKKHFYEKAKTPNTRQVIANRFLNDLKKHAPYF